MVVTCVADFWGKKVDLNEYMHRCVLDHVSGRDSIPAEPPHLLQPDDGILPPGDYEYKDLLNMKEHYCDMLGHKNRHVSIAAIISLTPSHMSNVLYIRSLAIECLLNWIEIERRTDTAEITYTDLEADEQRQGTSCGEEVKQTDTLSTAKHQGGFVQSNADKPETSRCEMLKFESEEYMRRKRGAIPAKIKSVVHDECCIVM